ncbi:MAG: hypothetical protein JHC31_12955 [Sulfurihydrogenibium sp.]|nr:hypothetical protein [Sulfurihydrogenibium sp.]
MYIASYISNAPILTLARFLIHPSIQSWHLFRKSKSERVYKILREYWQEESRLVVYDENGMAYDNMVSSGKLS